jgi:hypothetical protein
MLRLLLLALLMSWPTLAQTPGTFVGRNTDPNAPPLSAAALNAAFGTKQDVNGNSSGQRVTSAQTGTTDVLGNWVDQGAASLLLKPAYNDDLLSAKNQAPRRTQMTLSLGAFNPNYSQPPFAISTTYVAFVPLEAMAYAIRIAVADPFSTPLHILSAAAYPSDSYSGTLKNGVPWLKGVQSTAIPTANSVFQTCTTTSGSATVVCSNTASFPTAATMYAIGAGMPVNATATVSSGTNVTLSGNANANGTVTLQFANLAAECKLYYDNQGAAADTINTAGVSRTLTIAGNPASLNHASQAYTMQWSDFTPCTSAVRADGQTTNIMAVYITFGAGATDSFGYFASSLSSYSNNIAPSFANRFVNVGIEFNSNIDATDSPTAAGGFKGWDITPAIAVQYLTDAPGWSILQVGDSLSTAPPEDGFSTPIKRACMTVSTQMAPCEWSSVAWGGTGSPVYDEALRNNVQTLQPSAIVGQPIARGDLGGATAANMQMLMAKLQSYAQKADARLGFVGATPLTTTVDADATLQAAIAALRTRLGVISKTCQPGTGGQTCPMVPVLDVAKYVSRELLGGNAWDYLGMGATANGATAAMATSIPIVTQSGAPCLAGDILTDITTPGAILAGSTVASSTVSAIGVTNTAVIGGGVLAADSLVCSMPGWTGGALTYDNTHPWYPSQTLLQAPGLTFTKQLLGLQ